MLDQGQTITVDSVDEVYNLTTFDNYRTERICQTAAGTAKALRVDHSKLKGGAIYKHLIQNEIEIINSATDEVGSITINMTVTAPKWADPTEIINNSAGVTAWIATNLTRLLRFES